MRTTGDLYSRQCALSRGGACVGMVCGQRHLAGVALLASLFARAERGRTALAPHEGSPTLFIAKLQRVAPHSNRINSQRPSDSPNGSRWVLPKLFKRILPNATIVAHPSPGRVRAFRSSGIA